MKTFSSHLAICAKEGNFLEGFGETVVSCVTAHV
jgi:hypothetical protein